MEFLGSAALLPSQVPLTHSLMTLLTVVITLRCWHLWL